MTKNKKEGGGVNFVFEVALAIVARSVMTCLYWSFGNWDGRLAVAILYLYALKPKCDLTQSRSFLNRVEEDGAVLRVKT